MLRARREPQGDKMTLSSLVAKALQERRTLLTEVESKALVAAAGIPVVETYLAHSRKEALDLASRLGFPVVLKVTSLDIAHKSDLGGVKVNLQNKAAVIRAYEEILAAIHARAPHARLEGVAVQRMAPPGIEVILGASTDPQFGPFLMFGLGGVLVEVLQDVSFRLVPLTRRDARQMVREIKGYSVLQGYRGQPAADTEALEETLLSLSRLMETHLEIRELDLNPAFAYAKGLLAVDARVVLGEAPRV